MTLPTRKQIRVWNLAAVLGLIAVLAGGFAFAGDPAFAAPPTDVAADAPAPTAGVPDPGEDPAAFVQRALEAVEGGRWIPVAGLAVILIVWFVRRYVGNWVPWFRTDRGGTILALGTSFLSGVAHSAVARGGWPGWDAVIAAVGVATSAIGGYQGLKRIIAPKDRDEATGKSVPKVPRAIIRKGA